MAKKIDASKQGDNYLSSLLGERVITPLDEKEVSKVEESVKEKERNAPVDAYREVSANRDSDRQTYQSYPEMQDQDNIRRSRLGRKRTGEALKVGVSVSMDQNLYKDLKKIAFVNHLKVSNIIEEQVIKYVSYHSEDLEEFEKLPERVKGLAGI